MNKSELLKSAELGINGLELNDKYKKSTISNLEEWLGKKEKYQKYQEQIIFWIENEKWDIIVDAFFQIIPFGTGGRRGLVGIGTNRINELTIRNSAQGHSQYLLKKHLDIENKKIVIAYGVRIFLDNSDYNKDIDNPVLGLTAKKLAKTAAEVYSANGIGVELFEDYKTTPELSFAIRELNAMGGIMIDASHNPPSDCGKKVFDSLGGQLIPPYDQELTDEVTKNVNKIKIISFDDALKKKLIKYIPKSISEKYYIAVSKLALSDNRELKIVYTPLNGPGLTSIFPILKKARFDVDLDPETKNLSGKFENVKFNIPNPEVIQSFDTTLPYAKEKKADIILSSDPDADRIGIMAKHNDDYTFFNGNEIAVILSNYAITKLNKPNGIVVKTDVTTSLIEKIAEKNKIKCIGNLLVGFKYIADIQNKLEKEGRKNDFIFAAEESHGYIAGNYCRDKDAAIAALWLSELAADLKTENKTIVDYINDIYCEYGYYYNYLTEIRMLGAVGLEKINNIQATIRKSEIKTIGKYKVKQKIDFWDGDPFLSETDQSSRNVIKLILEDINEKEVRIIIRPSGTEPKIKFYIEIGCKPCDKKDLEKTKKEVEVLKTKLEKEFMSYCYKILDIDFPDRGYLLFWQLPLDAKLKYFEIEKNIIELKSINDKKERKNKLADLLLFLGSDPVEKVDEAFKAEYQKGIKEYLDI